MRLVELHECVDTMHGVRVEVVCVNMDTVVMFRRAGDGTQLWFTDGKLGMVVQESYAEVWEKA